MRPGVLKGFAWGARCAGTGKPFPFQRPSLKRPSIYCSDGWGAYFHKID